MEETMEETMVKKEEAMLDQAAALGLARDASPNPSPSPNPNLLTCAPADGSLIQAPIKPEADDALIKPESAGLSPPPATAAAGAEAGAPPPKRPRRDPDPNPGAVALADPGAGTVVGADPGVVAHAEEKTSAHAHRDEKPSADAPVAEAEEAEAEEGIKAEEAEEAEGIEPGTARYVMLTLRRLAAGGGRVRARRLGLGLGGLEP